MGFETVRREVMDDPITSLKRFSHIGDITVFHLAKNLGMNVAKPDRHLARLSNLHGYGDVHVFCAAISRLTGLSVRSVDSILWRMSAIGLGGEIFMTDVATAAARAH